ncbi:MAG: DUF4097 domain-containing protein [Bacteroidales bacterium]|nr:DUF4097 domain-containing protein [Candidatus Latescibacterota bacterium]
MTKRISMTILAVTAAVLIAGSPGTYASSEFEELSTSDISIEGQTKLIIEGINGRLSVIGEKRDDILLKVVKKGLADDREEADEMLSLMEVRVTRTAETIRLEAVYPKKFRTKKNIISFVISRAPRMSMEITLLMPEGMKLGASMASGVVNVNSLISGADISVASGELNVRDIRGCIKAALSSGAMEVINVDGTVVLSSASGTIKAREISGDMEASIASGRMELSELGGGLKCSIEYGSITVDGVGDVNFHGIAAESSFTGVRGAVDASTASGAADFRVIPVGDANYSIIASSGDISLIFITRMESGYVLKAGTTSGEISIDLPIDVKKVGRNSITGVVREGKSKVFLETASGDIIVEESEE